MVAINAFFKSMEVGPDNFTLTDEVNIDKFLGIKTTHLDNRRFKILQPFLINIIFFFLKMDSDDYGIVTNKKSAPVGKTLLHKDLSVKPCKENWNYHIAVGMLTYLQGDNRPEMSMDVHQTARFRTKPNLLHE